MPFSMSDRQNKTGEFEAGCPGAVSGQLISKEKFFGIKSSKNEPKHLKKFDLEKQSASAVIFGRWEAIKGIF